MRAASGIVVLFIGMGPALPAAAHIQLSSPTARYTQNNNGLETAPCGSGTASGVVTKVTPGQLLTVTWKESVSHAGHYRIGLSAKQSDFVDPTTLTIPDPLPAWDLVDGIPDKTGMQTYSQSVQIPDQECPACVLQLIQVASAGTDGTNTGSVFAIYHACADLAITAGASDGGTAHDAPVDMRADLALGSRDGMPARDGLAATGDVALAGKDVAFEDVAQAGGAGGTTGTGGGGAGGSGAGGAYGTGGTTAHASGGATTGTSGSDGRATGGAPGSGGTAQVGSGGSAGQGSGGSGSPMGSGGRSATTALGGAGGSNGGTGGGTAATGTPSSTNGCSCQTGNREPQPGWPWVALLALGFGLGLGTRRRSRP